MTIKLICSLVEEPCDQYVNKNYNYGFSVGSAGWCKMRKEWVCDLKGCSKKFISGSGHIFTENKTIKPEE